MIELLKYIQSIYPLTPEALAMLTGFLKEKKVLKGHHWLKTEDVCERIAFIQSGLVRIYFISGSKEVCLWYNRENEVMLSVHSFYKQIKSYVAIQAVTDVTLYYLNHAELQQVFDKHVGFNINARLILEHYYGHSEMHVVMLLESTEKRIEMICELYPWMLEDPRINDKMLAAYMGISPEHLCRFKNFKKKRRKKK